MESKSSGKKLPLNLFDIIIIGIVILAAAGLIFTRLHSNDNNDVKNQGTVEYAVEITNLSQSTEGMIKSGDKIEDKIKKLYMGEVKSVEFYPATKEATDYKTGNTVYTEVPERLSARITLRADCRQTDKEITVNGGYVVRIGSEVSILGPGYSGAGYLVGIKRGDA